jgi:hypothetical protein
MNSSKDQCITKLKEIVTVKISVDIETNAQEMREFMGLPDVRPLQEEMMQTIKDSMQKGAAGFDPLSLMKPLFPAQMQSMEMLQKAFWDSFNKTATEENNKKSS